MTGQEIIASVLARTGVSEADFFSKSRIRPITAARKLAIQELSVLNLSASAIGRIVGLDHVTVLYWQRPEMRERRRLAYASQYVPRPRKPASPKAPRPRKPRPRKVPARIERDQCFYTPEQDAIARDLLARGANDSECIRILGRDRGSIRKRIRRLDDPEFQERCREYHRKRQEKRRETGKVGLPLKDVTVAQAEDARARAVAPRSLTAWTFGDPPPGHSALDRRNNSEARA